VKVLLLVLCLLLFPAAVQATTIKGEHTEPFQTWANQSLAPTPSGEVYMTFGSPVAELITPRTIGWWQMSTGLGEAERATFLHELGHVFDHTLLTYRPKIRRLLAYAIRPGVARAIETKHQRIPKNLWTFFYGEQFAMGYAFCALDVADPPLPYWWGYKYNPTPRQQARVCALIRGAA
jgi:hypothetical protein